MKPKKEGSGMGFFDKIKQGLKKTSDAVAESIGDVFASFVKVD